MNDLYILGGEMRPNAAKKSEWQHFQNAVAVKVDAASHQAALVHEYVSPPEVCADLPSVLFKAGSLHGDRLYTCTQTEIIVYRLPDFTVEHYVSQPYFNDIHHVAPSGRGTLLIAVTGLDIIVEIGMDGTLLQEWDVSGGDVWQRFSRDVDYRKVPTTKPRVAHPNFVFTLGDEIWATRCDLYDAVCLTDESKRIDLSGPSGHPVEFVHDGVLHDGKLYFTAVDGHVLIVDAQRCVVSEIIDLSDFVDTDYPLGWCRGIKIVDSERIIVGFSRLRQTKLHEKVRWAKAQVRRLSGDENYAQSLPSLPTRVSCFNLATRTLEWDVPLSDHKIDAVFSIL